MNLHLVIEMLFNGVCKCMAKVQQHTSAGVELIFFYNLAFDVYASGNYFRKHLFQILKGSVGCQCLKEIRIFNTAIFDDFAHTVDDETLTQCVKDCRIDQYQGRLIKCTDQILALRKIDSDLAAYG